MLKRTHRYPSWWRLLQRRLCVLAVGLPFLASACTGSHTAPTNQAILVTNARGTNLGLDSTLCGRSGANTIDDLSFDFTATSVDIIGALVEDADNAQGTSYAPLGKVTACPAPDPCSGVTRGTQPTPQACIVSGNSNSGTIHVIGVEAWKPTRNWNLMVVAGTTHSNVAVAAVTRGSGVGAFWGVSCQSPNPHCSAPFESYSLGASYVSSLATRLTFNVVGANGVVVPPLVCENGPSSTATPFDALTLAANSDRTGYTITAATGCPGIRGGIFGIQFPPVPWRATLTFQELDGASIVSEKTYGPITVPQ